MTLRNESTESASVPSDDSVTSEGEVQERFRLYRLCECGPCGGTGRVDAPGPSVVRCSECRGEGRVRQIVATAATEQGVGVALVTLGREGEWEGCPFGLLDAEGEKGQKWIVSPWLPSPRNISDAARVLGTARKGEK